LLLYILVNQRQFVAGDASGVVNGRRHISSRRSAEDCGRCFLEIPCTS
jgi:hypothetical protein